jgi:TolB-like protein
VRLLFSGHVLDIDRRELRRGDELISVGPQVFDLLVYLVQNRERVVSKDDLFEAVWQGRIVSESTLTTHINAVRKAVGDTGEEQSLIRTVPRKGFRFVGDIREDGTAQPLTSGVPPIPTLTLPDKPSIAVLPFQNLSGDPEQDYFADGVVEDIIAALSRIRWLFVIARNSSFTYKGRAVDVKQVGRALGVRYVLEGSLRKAGNRVRITGQLIDASTGANLWADRFEGALEDIFELQDQVTTSVVGALVPKAWYSKRLSGNEGEQRVGVTALQPGNKTRSGICRCSCRSRVLLSVAQNKRLDDRSFTGDFRMRTSGASRGGVGPRRCRCICPQRSCFGICCQ